MQFYLAVDGKQDGPFPEEQVRQRIASGLLQPTDHCWTVGWTDWRQLQDVFVAEFREAAPPPLASWETLASRPADEAAARRSRLPIRRDQTSAGIFAVVAILGVLMVLVGIAWLIGRRSSEEDSPRPRQIASEAPVSRGRLAAERNAAREAARDIMRETAFSGSNLEQIAEACHVYARAHGGRLPTYSAQLQPLFGARFADLMDVPETPERESSGYVVRMGLDTSMPDDTPIAFEAGTRPDGTRGVVYMDGTVRVLARGDPALQRALGW